VGRVDVSVIAWFTPEKRVMPLKLLTGKGERIKIDKVLDIRPAASLIAGGCGTRYICRCTAMIEDQEIPVSQLYLFRDDDTWYCEVDDI
jgi:hypothetical protein